MALATKFMCLVEAKAAWVPMLLSSILFTVFMIWRNGRLQLRKALAAEAIPIERRHLATHEDHLWRLTDRDRIAVDPALLPVMTWTGSRAEIHERLVALGESGATEILYQPMGPDLERELDAFMDAARG